MRGKRSWLVGLVVTVLCGVSLAEETATKEMAGRVTCPNGNPVAGAEVTFYGLGLDRVTMTYQAKELGGTQTDQDGLFSFTAQVSETESEEILCLVKHEGYAWGWSNYHSTAGQMDVQLAMPNVLAGVVQDEAGSPVAGAQVRLLFVAVHGGESPSFIIGIEPIDIFATVTGGDGSFEFTGLPDTASAEILVKKAGMGTIHTFDDPQRFSSGLLYKAGQTDIQLTLPAGRTLRGKVVETAGRTPVAGIAVQARVQNFPLNLLGKSVMSGEDGTFAIADVAPGEYLLVALSSDWVSAPMPVEVEAAGDTQATIELSKGGVLEVCVVDGATEEKLAGANVMIHCEQLQQQEQLLTEADGTAKKQLAPGTYQVQVYKQGYRSSGSGQEVTVADGKTASVTVTLGDQQKLTGRVLDAKGKPVEGAEVTMVPSLGSMHGRTITTDKDGVFKLGWNPREHSWVEGDFHVVVFQKERHLAGTAPVGADTEEVTVKLSDAAGARGRVIDPDGKPIAGARTMLYFRGGNYSTTFGVETLTDSDGKYEFACLPTEQALYVNVTQAQGYGIGSSNEFAAQAAEIIEVADLILQVADQKITGTIVDPDGKPLANASISAHGESQPHVQAKSDSEGRFVLENVCAGRIFISANYRDGNTYRHGGVQTEGGAQDVQVVVGAQDNGRYVPRKPASLVGKPLEDLSACGLDLPAEPGAVALFVWDVDQRPSRHFAKAFAEKAALLKEKGVTAMLLQAAPTDRAKLDAWLKDNEIACPCGMIAEDAEATTFNLGVQGLPWLILTDGEGKVVAEGFGVNELEGKLSQAQ